MAFGDTVQSAQGTGTSGEASATLGAGATAGNLIIFAIARSAVTAVTGDWGAISGFTAFPQSPGNTGNMGSAAWWKIAAGGETTVTTASTDETGNWCAAVVEIEGPFAASPLDKSAEDESHISSTATSQSSGTTATTTQNDELAVAYIGADNGSNVSTTRAYTNSFSEVIFANSGARASVIVAKKVLSATGAIETTFSTAGTGDEMYGAIATFKKSTGSNQTVTMDTLTLAGSAVTMTVVPGAVTPAMNTLTLAGSVPTMTVVPGSVAVLLDVLTLAGSVPDLTVVAVVSVGLNSLTLAGSVPDLTVVPGAVAIALDTLNLAASVPDLTITIGVFISMNTLTLAGSVPDLSVAPGAVAVALDALNLAGSVPDLSVIPGAVAIALDTLNLAASVPSLTVYATVTIALDTLSLAGSVPDLTVTPGGVSIALDTLTLLASAETLSIPGGAIVDYLIRVGLVSRTAGQKPAQLIGRREPRTKGNDNPA